MSPDRPSSNAGFAGFSLHPSILRGIADLGFVEPRPIQREAIPAALEGRDVLGLAQTGTGKTAAFALPMLQRLGGRRLPGPRALVVAPTRELATQISTEIERLGRHTRMRVVTVFGGVSPRPQIAALRKDPEIVVACPGRLIDLLGQRALRLDRVELLVLDEADHMFDMGFLPDVRRILGALPARRQNLMFSATMPREIRALAKQVLERPHVVECGHSRPASTVEHALYPVEGNPEKVELLRRLLAADDFVSAIVFTRTKHRAKRLARQLEQSGHRAAALQGNMSQNARERAMGGFRERRYDVLVATDIAARGIDVEQISHVINFDVPGTVDAYTHRIGRTGRAERTGRAYTFVTPEDRAMVDAVERVLGESIPRRNADGTLVDGPTSRPPAHRGAAKAGNDRKRGIQGNRGGRSRRRRSRRRSNAA